MKCNNKTMGGNDISNYLEYQIGQAINLYYPPCLVLFGSIGNMFSFIVHKQQQFRKRSSTVFLSLLAVTDTLMLLLGLLQYWILFNFFPTVLTKAHCKGMFFVVKLFGNYSHWIVVCFSIDRFIAVQFPIKSNRWSTPEKSKLCLCCVAVIAFFKNLHYIMTTDFFYDTQKGMPICAFGLKNKASWITIYQGFEVTVSSILPFTIIFFCNFMIIRKIHQQQTRKISPQKMRISSNRDGITKTLLLVSTVFVITTCPLQIFRLYFASIDVSRSSALTQAQYNLGHNICHKLWYTNNGVNFLLYCWSSKSFRRNLIKPP